MRVEARHGVPSGGLVTTPLRNLVGGTISIIGIGVFALPAGILASGFTEQLQKRRTGICPYCGTQQAHSSPAAGTPADAAMDVQGS